MKKIVTSAVLTAGIGLAALAGAGVAAASEGNSNNNCGCQPQTTNTNTVRKQAVRVAVKQTNATGGKTTANTNGKYAVGGVVQSNGNVTVTVSQ